MYIIRQLEEMKHATSISSSLLQTFVEILELCRANLKQNTKYYYRVCIMCGVTVSKHYLS